MDSTMRLCPLLPQTRSTAELWQPEEVTQCRLACIHAHLHHQECQCSACQDGHLPKSSSSRCVHSARVRYVSNNLHSFPPALTISLGTATPATNSHSKEPSGEFLQIYQPQQQFTEFVPGQTYIPQQQVRQTLLSLASSDLAEQQLA